MAGPGQTLAIALHIFQLIRLDTFPHSLHHNDVLLMESRKRKPYFSGFSLLPVRTSRNEFIPWTYLQKILSTAMNIPLRRIGKEHFELCN